MRPQGKTLKRGRSGGDEDRIGDLPDGILHHIIGFLPAPEAVRTCVLARRWRHLWKSATGVRVTDLDGEEPVPMEKLQDFLDHVLLLRGRAPLDTCWLSFSRLSESAATSRRINLWFRHAVLCEVRDLRLGFWNAFQPKLDDLPLVSKHLVKLHLSGVHLMHNFPDYSSCPVLEHLGVDCCDLSDAKKISSQSLTGLKINSCVFSQVFRTRIYVPNLISLWLETCWYRTPVFEVMPSLAGAYVCVTNQSGDWHSCRRGDAGFQECPCDDCDFCHSNSNGVVRSGRRAAVWLSTCMELRPSFNTHQLLFNSCCVAFDLHGITSILQYTPVLEKLTLEFTSEGPENDDEVEMKGSCTQMERSSAISKHLKLVVIKCKAIDGSIIKNFNFMSALNIRKITSNTIRSFYISEIFIHSFGKESK